MAASKETIAVAARRASIAQVMIVVALAALNLAFLRTVPLEVSSYPTVWVLLGSIDFVFFWKLIWKRSLQAFHYTFLIVFVLVYLVMANAVAMERIHPLGLVIRWHQQLNGSNATRISLGFLWIGEFWMACFLSLALASAIGLIAAWFERYRDWDIAAFWRGALVGFGTFTLLAVLYELVGENAQPTPVQLTARLVVLAICMILGGRMGLSRLRSTRPGREGHSDLACVATGSCSHLEHAASAPRTIP